MKRITSVIALVAILGISSIVSRSVLADSEKNQTDSSSGVVSYSSAFLAAHPRCSDQKEGSFGALNCEAGAKRDAAEAEMKATYEKQMHRLQNTKAREYLAEAQKRWIAYRDVSCGYEAVEWMRGAETNALQVLCQAKKDDQRTQELKAYLACTENGCPE